MADLKTALYYMVGLVAGFVAHEYAQVRAASAFGDQTPRFKGRASLDPRVHADPLGTYVFPALLLLVVASGGRSVPPIAYGKSMPIDASRMRNPRRDYVLTLLAGPAATFLLAVLAAAALRVTRQGELGVFFARCLMVNVMLTVFDLMPIPPLDGSRILAEFLPAKAKSVMGEMQVYGGYFMLVILFILRSPALSVVQTLGNGLCKPLVGFPCL